MSDTTEKGMSSAVGGLTNVTILTTNDIHGRFLEEGGAIDFSKLATLRKSNPDWLMVDAGDSTQGTPFAIMKKGLYPIQILNAVGYDILTIGNHEFDNITKDEVKCELDDIIKGFAKDYISANVKNRVGQNYIESLGRQNGRYTVKTVNGLNLLFIGISTPDMSLDIERMEDFKIGGMDEIIESSKAIISEAKAQYGTINAVIALSHLGTRGEITCYELAKQMTDFDLIIDGHSHEKINKTVNKGSTLITQSECYGKLVGKITLTFDNGKLTDKEIEFLDRNSLNGYTQNETVRQKLVELKKELDNIFGRRWAEFSAHTLWGGAIDEEQPYLLRAVNISRYAQTNMGDIAAQAMIETIQNRKNELNQKMRNEADMIKEDDYIIGGINGGGLRDGIAFGKEIRNYELFNVLPSHLHSAKESGFSLFRITLRELKEILENSVSRISYKNHVFSTSDGRFMNLSGLRYTIARGESGLKIGNQAVLDRAINPMTGDRSIDFEKDGDTTVLFCTGKYLASGGDGYGTLKKKTPLTSVDDALFQIAGEYIRNQCGGGRFEYKMVSDNISYQDFDFEEPSATEVTLIDENSQELRKQNVIYCFSTAQGKEYKIVSTDDFGRININPPKGNSILQIMVLMPFKKKKYGENLYGELYLHTYYSLRNDMKLTARLEKSDKVQFPDKPLATFCHTLSSSGGTHYSNYLDYCTLDGKEASFLIFDNKIYTKDRDKNEFMEVDEVKYRTADDGIGCFSLYLCYPTWGGDKYKGEILYCSEGLVEN